MIGDVSVLAGIQLEGQLTIGTITYLPADGLNVCLEDGDLTESPLRMPVEIEASLKDLLDFCVLPAPYLEEKLSDGAGLRLNILYDDLSIAGLSVGMLWCLW